MIHHATTLEGFHVHGLDGKIGRIEDFYFDDESWKLRYFVVNPGGWFRKSNILVSPAALTEVSASERLILTDLTTEQVRNSPEVDDHQPLSRQKETDLHAHYGWPEYWAGTVPSGVVHGGSPPGVPMTSRRGAAPASNATITAKSRVSHLNGAKEIADYHVAATNGSIGKVDDILLDEQGWKIRYILINTLNLPSCKKVLITPACTTSVSRSDATITLKLSRERIERIPVYNPESGVRFVPRS